jgi:membrane protein
MFGRGKDKDDHKEAKGSPPAADPAIRESTGLEAQHPPGHPIGDRADAPRRSPLFVAKRTWREFTDDGCTDLAAALTYYSVLALFPGLIALLSLVGLLGQGDESVNTIMDTLKPFITDPHTLKSVHDAIESLATASGVGVALVVGIVGALWSASGYVGAFGRAMNRIYEVEEGRPAWKLRPMQLVVTVVTVVLCAVALVILVVSGPVTKAIGDAIGVGSDVQRVWDIAKWPALAVVVMVIVAMLYWATPNVRFPKFRIISVGAFVAILVWLVASVGFAFYVGNFSSYNKTYGSLAGAIVALLWLWLTNVALMFGAELDAELERGRELQRGMAAEEILQLPVRDRHGIDKAHARRAADIEKQRDIRLAVTAGRGDPEDRPFGH